MAFFVGWATSKRGDVGRLAERVKIIPTITEVREIASNMRDIGTQTENFDTFFPSNSSSNTSMGRSAPFNDPFSLFQPNAEKWAKFRSPPL